MGLSLLLERRRERRERLFPDDERSSGSNAIITRVGVAVAQVQGEELHARVFDDVGDDALGGGGLEDETVAKDADGEPHKQGGGKETGCSGGDHRRAAGPRGRPARRTRKVSRDEKRMRKP